MRPQCKYVHLLEGKIIQKIRNLFLKCLFFFYLDFVEVKNGYVSICKEAILGNCSTNECKFIIFVLKNFNGKFFHLIITKHGVRTLMPRLQPPLLQQIIHISHLFFSFHLSFSFTMLYILTNKYTRTSFFFFFYVHTYTHWSFFVIHTHTKNMYLFFLSLCLWFLYIFFFLLICSFVRCFQFVMKSFTVYVHIDISLCVWREKQAIYNQQLIHFFFFYMFIYHYPFFLLLLETHKNNLFFLFH